MRETYQPLGQLTDAECRAVKYVLCDIDDTLTLHGRLLPVDFDRLARLQEAGLIVLPVTGRPAGWCDQIARQWPVYGVVGENGALFFRYDSARRQMVKQYWQSAEQRAADRQRLDQISRRVLQEVPGAQIASDQAYREADLAIDYNEDVPELSAADVSYIVALFEGYKATAKVSSIHINGWFGDYDKLSMTLRVMSAFFDFDSAKELERVVFVGDSPNDAPMFGYFPNAVGVANIKAFDDYQFQRPRWITQGAGGHGFAEVADRLLGART